MNPLQDAVRARLTALGKKSQGPFWHTIESPQGGVIRIQGRELVMMASNDYLGLANHPEIVAAAAAAVREWGAGVAAARFIASQPLQATLEEELADYLGFPAAITYSSAFAANNGVIPPLAAEGDTVISDELNHASIIDGCRLAKAERHVYRHGDAAALEQVLAGLDGRSGLKLVISDGVFSMEGDLAPLPDLVAAAERHGAVLMVDDAHATGFIGPTGRGTMEQFGLQGRVPVLSGTLGKALGGAAGGFVASDAETVALLAQASRPFIFSNGLPPACVASALAALRLIRRDSGPRERLWENTRRLRAGLAQVGLKVLGGGSPITPVLVGENEPAQRLAQAVWQRGVYAVPFTFPVVPRGTARIRLMPTGAHTPEQIDRVVQAFAEGARECGLA